MWWEILYYIISYFQRCGAYFICSDILLFLSVIWSAAVTNITLTLWLQPRGWYSTFLGRVVVMHATFIHTVYLAHIWRGNGVIVWGGQQSWHGLWMAAIQKSMYWLLLSLLCMVSDILNFTFAPVINILIRAVLADALGQISLFLCFFLNLD